MRVRLETGEEGTAIRLDGHVLVLVSPRAFAPGSPIRFSVVAENENRKLEGRTIGSKRMDAGPFEVRLRLVNLRRVDRELLLKELG